MSSVTSRRDSVNQGSLGEEVPLRPLSTALSSMAAKHPRALAVTSYGTDKSLTYARWDRLSSALAQDLTTFASPGDVIVLHFDDVEHTEVAIGVLGAIKAGCFALPLSNRFPSSEVLRIAENYDAAAVVCGEDAASRLGEGNRRIATLTAMIRHAEKTGTDEQVGVAQSDGGCIVYTSGTTGTPRAVVCPPDDLAYWLSWQPTLGSRGILHQFPFDTSGAVAALMFALSRHPVVHVSPFDINHLAQALAKYRPHDLVLVPASVRALLQRAVHLDEAACAGVRTVIMTSAIADDDLVAYTRATFPAATVVNFYATTEGGSANTFMPYLPTSAIDTVTRPGFTCVGFCPESSAARITDDAGKELGPGSVGSVWLRPIGRAPRRYFGVDATMNAETFDGDWVRTGDVGFIDADTGALYLSGRESDTINKGGVNVSSQHIEEALRRHPAVVDAAVFAVTDPTLGEDVAAAVVAAAPALEADLREFVGRTVGRFYAPTHVVFVPSIPVNSMGKVVKRTLREQVERLLDGRRARPRVPAGRDVAAPDDVEKVVTEIWRRALGGDGSEDFFESGAESIVALEIAAAIEDTLGVELSALDVLEFSNTKALSAAVFELVRVKSEP